MSHYFDKIDKIRYEGPHSTNRFAYRHYNADERVLGKRMEDHLRLAVCYWHSFCWGGTDMFGTGAFARPWQGQGDALVMAQLKADVAFEFFAKLGVPYYCFHDVDVSPEGNSLADYRHNLAAMTDVLAQKQQPTASNCCGALPIVSAIRATAPAPRPIPIRRFSPGRRRRSTAPWKRPNR